MSGTTSSKTIHAEAWTEGDSKAMHELIKNLGTDSPLSEFLRGIAARLDSGVDVTMVFTPGSRASEVADPS